MPQVIVADGRAYAIRRLRADIQVFLGSERLTELQRATAFSCTINHDPISALRLRTE
ncbi:hypothetical protein X735_23860 [Mesorhizobium sp. L2C085B000]|nr:hypothetical protein X735_23860 [Mesorhizobium sp. L2C085B000]